jgi:glyceraldehyde 3-phosphate dehydrogenase
MIDLKIVPGRSTTRDEINDALSKAASSGPLRGILAVIDEPLVSIDFNHNAASSTAALPQTQVVDGSLVRVLSWYDNEWGFSTRMADVALAMGKLG